MGYFQALPLRPKLDIMGKTKPRNKRVNDVFTDENINSNNSTHRVNGARISGNNNDIYGDNNVIYGNNLTVRGHGNTVIGNNNDVVGNHNHVTGNNNFADGFNNSMKGNNNDSHQTDIPLPPAPPDRIIREPGLFKKNPSTSASAKKRVIRYNPYSFGPEYVDEPVGEVFEFEKFKWDLGTIELDETQRDELDKYMSDFMGNIE